MKNIEELFFSKNNKEVAPRSKRQTCSIPFSICDLSTGEIRSVYYWFIINKNIPPLRQPRYVFWILFLGLYEYIKKAYSVQETFQYRVNKLLFGSVDQLSDGMDPCLSFVALEKQLSSIVAVRYPLYSVLPLTVNLSDQNVRGLDLSVAVSAPSPAVAGHSCPRAS